MSPFDTCQLTRSEREHARYGDPEPLPSSGELAAASDRARDRALDSLASEGEGEDEYTAEELERLDWERSVEEDFSDRDDCEAE